MWCDDRLVDDGDGARRVSDAAVFRLQGGLNKRHAFRVGHGAHLKRAGLGKVQDAFIQPVPMPYLLSFFLGAKTQLTAGDPGWIRTSDPQLRRLMLCPAELRGRPQTV
jgi:hypothetical protein